MISQKKLFAREAIFFFVLFLREKNKEEEGGHKSVVRTRFSKFCTKPAIEKTVYIMCFFLYSVYKLLSVDRIGVVFLVTSIRKELSL